MPNRGPNPASKSAVYDGLCVHGFVRASFIFLRNFTHVPNSKFVARRVALAALKKRAA